MNEVNSSQVSRQAPPAPQSAPARNGATLLPPVDVVEDSAGITLFADLPGVPKDKLNLHIEGDNLCIEGDVDIDLPQGMAASYAEVNLARYRRVFTLSKELDGGKVSAQLNQGVLKLRIPKAEHAQPRRIQVSGG
ncbi:MAG: Hsp20/alpha crystallin family protein [Burkholderiales bacterium]|nr:Hsp20/alpha crystallin family protein [Burkholderiales bacterium]